MTLITLPINKSLQISDLKVGFHRISKRQSYKNVYFHLDSALITKCVKPYYKVRQLFVLQSVSKLITKCVGSIITKCVSYYKVWRLLQSELVHLGGW